jgi:nucleoside-diphosphate-sugar epimerase
VDAAFAGAKADVLVNIASLGFGHAPTVLAAAEEAGIERGVFVSTTAVFTTLNASSKSVRLRAEEAVDASPIASMILRPTMIYGAPGDRNMERLLALLQRTPLVPMPGRGDRLQQPVHVADLAQAIVAAAERVGEFTGSLEVAGPEPLTFRQVVEQAATAVGRRPRFVPVPLGLVRGAVGVQERILRNPRLKREQIDRLAEDKAFDITAARRELGFDPRPFAQGIAQEAEACRR